jgi:hypothetical protein
MTDAAETCAVASKRTRFPPGFLLAPFGWATEWLAAAVEAEPPLLAELYFLSRRRMHLIALALAHLDEPARAGMRRSCCAAPPAKSSIACSVAGRAD